MSTATGTVPVRKAPDGPVLRFGAPAWAALVALVRDHH
ncbi:DUF397 domain-containing protein [Streptomyces sp. NPDC051567]